MSITKRALLASGATLALASTVRAQAPGPYQGTDETQDVILDHLFDNQGLHIDQDGRVTRLKMGTNGMAAVRPHGREMNTGHALVYRENGRTYMCSNEKLNDGTNLFDHRRDWRS